MVVLTVGLQLALAQGELGSTRWLASLVFSASEH
jgi:hypothetical protein